MKRTLFVLALAVVLTMTFVAAAYAEHAPSNYSQWSTSVGTNNVVQSPHAGYTATTVKCSVCHSVHRSAVMGENIRNQVGGDWIVSSTTAPTEMLLRSSVAESCNYCHIDTAAGGVRLWNGNSENWGETEPFSSGYAHNHTACVECHAVHGAKTFKGAAAGKTLKYNADNVTNPQTFDSMGTAGDTTDDILWGINPNVVGNEANHTYTEPVTGLVTVVGIQDEIYTEDATGELVDPLNKAQFATLADCIEGDPTGLVNDAVGQDMKDLQVGAFCTTCHGSMYASDSFQVVNPDQDVTLFGGTYGTWAPEITGFEYQSGTWKTKGHPVVAATNDFAAQGSTLGAGQTIAWGGAETCRKCHDAGTDDAPTGIVYSSWPHVTPGYYRFMGAGSDAATYSVAGAQVSMVGVGEWLDGGEVVALGGATAGDESATEAGGYMLYPGQNYKSDNPLNPQQSSHIGVDGLCLKCHVSGTGLGVGLTY